MGRSREDIYTSLADTINVSVRGIDNQRKVYIHQKQHSGPATNTERDIYLVMDTGESLSIALSLISMLPLNFFDNEEYRETLKKIRNLVDTVLSSQPDDKQQPDF